MNKPILVIMAAGMGSRYGGLKQIEPIDSYGHIIMDFSVYDAKLAGFEEVVFIIKKENEEIFRQVIGERVSGKMKVHYVFQELDDLPAGFSVPEGRVKPWGTGHAVYAARNVINGPFVVINADDYYGREAFKLAFDYLKDHEDTPDHYMMAGYILKNTVTENGSVSRGICDTDPDGNLLGITERTKIVMTENGCAHIDEDTKEIIPLDPDGFVSMNIWGLSHNFIDGLERQFVSFLTKAFSSDPLTSEFYLPFAVDELLKEDKVSVKVLPTNDKWYGVTYKEDKAAVTQAPTAMEKEGKYPDGNW